jgi:hypothetical protein
VAASAVEAASLGVGNVWTALEAFFVSCRVFNRPLPYQSLGGLSTLVTPFAVQRLSRFAANVWRLASRCADVNVFGRPALRRPNAWAWGFLVGIVWSLVPDGLGGLHQIHNPVDVKD